mmetsp:Transcript_25086/g.39871  ORF Transcript_25086/g.39871 Transcript_25086/m.39871 type:complete len:225 (+) Transcript_25086:726-1400(+)
MCTNGWRRKQVRIDLTQRLTARSLHALVMRMNRHGVVQCVHHSRSSQSLCSLRRVHLIVHQRRHHLGKRFRHLRIIHAFLQRLERRLQRNRLAQRFCHQRIIVIRQRSQCQQALVLHRHIIGMLQHALNHSFAHSRFLHNRKHSRDFGAIYNRIQCLAHNRWVVVALLDVIQNMSHIALSNVSLRVIRVHQHSVEFLQFVQNRVGINLLRFRLLLHLHFLHRFR